LIISFDADCRIRPGPNAAGQSPNAIMAEIDASQTFNACGKLELDARFVAAFSVRIFDRPDPRS
jgi:hypothetical protein